jgi:hypothetical protein
MNPNANLWIDALRSGAYRQATRRLRRPTRLFWQPPRLCAIGVLYDVYLRSRGAVWPDKAPIGELPGEVIEWAGISRELEREVVARNDGGMSFRDIASVVEAHLHRAERKRCWHEARRVAGDLIEHAQDLARRARDKVAAAR